MREAVALAIDEPPIASRVMLGLGHPTWEMWGPGVNGYDAALDVRPKADPAKAKQLLADAGYPERVSGRTGLPERPLCDGRADLHRDRSMLARIGIKVDLHAQTKAKYLQPDTVAKLQYRLLYAGLDACHL